jgi:hypothetical protein
VDESADEVGRRLREAIAGLGRHRTQPLPQELHAEVERYAALRRRAGASWRTIAGSVGVSASALQRWGARERSSAVRAGLRRVRVRREWVPSQTVASATLVLISPSGFRVEGLGVAQALEMLRELQ